MDLQGNTSQYDVDQSHHIKANSFGDCSCYMGRIAPTPSGLMHLGHAQTFWIAMMRARKMNGQIILRVEDIDQQRCKSFFFGQMMDDLSWFGIRWDAGPSENAGTNLKMNCFSGSKNELVGQSLNELEGQSPSYVQSQRSDYYKDAWQILYEKGHIYPSPHSRRDVERAVSAPNEGDTEIIFPTSLRCPPEDVPKGLTKPSKTNWRFRVPDGEVISFYDVRCGHKAYVAGVDFGDFVIWRSDGMVSYELAVVVDDASMSITEVVRGEDLLLSTARQLLLYRALNLSPPFFLHCPLVRDFDGRRLAKRDAKVDIDNNNNIKSTSTNTLKYFREEGWTPQQIRQRYFRVLENDPLFSLIDMEDFICVSDSHSNSGSGTSEYVN